MTTLQLPEQVTLSREEIRLVMSALERDVSVQAYFTIGSRIHTTAAENAEQTAAEKTDG